jgi:hypothetical protein
MWLVKFLSFSAAIWILFPYYCKMEYIYSKRAHRHQGNVRLHIFGVH